MRLGARMYPGTLSFLNSTDFPQNGWPTWQTTIIPEGRCAGDVSAFSLRACSSMQSRQTSRVEDTVSESTTILTSVFASDSDAALLMFSGRLHGKSLYLHMFCEFPDGGITSGPLGMFRAWLAGPTPPAGRCGTCTRAAAAIFDRNRRGPCPIIGWGWTQCPASHAKRSYLRVCDIREVGPSC
ncbi:uncharacterized protein K489DRAFT_263400 [Dissoconium aciculare CBS 342.82]|uniref:Uncharacterized protein n=1 Tax=Dissoconium aciculare CBS 342.82 TaxID=1314786 RepID=A0A6J3LZF6_9PEZI|nr:uncharacterized protein K489DRAFT_263400 [Dissoconium aciculare CBS 342.82]KAF1821038.1 hypothetical protein K489DRAFT_263400 [Dissoconium aciculare CBS 342.82]